MREKIITVAVGVFLTASYFFIGSYFENFVTKADYNKDMQVISEIKSDLIHLKQGQIEIKDAIKR